MSSNHVSEETQEAEPSEEEYEGTCEYTIAPPLRVALNKELGAIMSIIQETLPQNTQDDSLPDSDKAIIQSIKGTGGRLIRRTLDLHTSKRLCSDNSKLVVRLFGIPKLPSKPVISQFLADFSVTALKKSEKSKMYIATLPNYKQYDRICKLGSALLGDFTLQIKPLHMCGPKVKPLRPDFKKKKDILGSIYESVKPKKNEPQTKNTSKPTTSKQEFSLDDAIVLDELVESDTNYDEDIPIEDLEDY